MSTSPSMSQRRRLRPPMLNLPHTVTFKLSPVHPPPVPRVEEEAKVGAMWALHARRGRRRSAREDMYAVHPFATTDAHGTPISLFAVFDGHGGSRAAKFASFQLPQHVLNAISKGTSIADALTIAFLTTDHEFSATSPLPSVTFPPPLPSKSSHNSSVSSSITASAPKFCRSASSSSASQLACNSCSLSTSTSTSSSSSLKPSSAIKPNRSYSRLSLSETEKLSRTPSGSSFGSVALQCGDRTSLALKRVLSKPLDSNKTVCKCAPGDKIVRSTGALSRVYSADQSSSSSSGLALFGNSGMELRRCKTRVDEHLSNVVVPKEQGSGTTATLVTLLGTRHIVVAHVGDTRAVLCRRGGDEVIRLCEDHRPDRLDESARIEAAGGLVVKVRGTTRVNGVLAVSRSIGDLELKDIVIARPDVTSFELTGNEDFVMIASDGLWDMISDEEGVKVVQTAAATAKQRGDDARWEDESVKALVECAWEKGSTDDICVVLVDLKKYVKLCEDLQAVTPINEMDGAMTHRRRGQKAW